MVQRAATLLGGAALSASITSRTTPPEAVETLTVFPQLDGAILGSCRIKLSIGRKRNGPDRAVVTLVDI